MSFFESKKERLERRKLKRAQEAEDAAGLEFPVLMDHTGPDIAAADAVEATAAAAREQARVARAAKAAEIAAEIPEAQVARAALTEYWENLDAHRVKYANGYYPTAELFYAVPHKNLGKIYDACRAAHDAYKALGNMDKAKEYADYATKIYSESRGYVMGGKKSKYSRKSKSKYSRKSKSKYSRKSKSKYSRKY